MTRKNWAVAICAFALAVFTQVFQLTSVPGLHFDEAWQGFFAHRIANESGFWPLSAMNSYTGPVLHYILAPVFKIFGSSLQVMRVFFAALNLSTLTLLMALMWKSGKKTEVFWFAVLWALLPASVHNHRFYVEVTAFHGFCFALFAWGIFLWKQKPKISASLLIGSLFIGAFTHILFLTVFIITLFVGAAFYPEEFFSKRARKVVGISSFILFVLLIKMSLGLHKVLPGVLGFAFASAGVLFSVADERKLKFLGKLCLRLLPVLSTLALPFLILFSFLFVNGFWPYAQATGHLPVFWLPLNLILFWRLVYVSFQKKALKSDLLWNLFNLSLLFTQLIIFKPSSRYYMIPLILGMIWMATQLANIKARTIQALLLLSFCIWNFWGFQNTYIRQFQTAGPTNGEFHHFIFHDSGRDFRPFQKVFNWLIKQNCQDTFFWVENDRFMYPINFLKLSAPQETKEILKCPWQRNDLFLSHIPNYIEDKTKVTRNITPPEPNVEFLAHDPEWGDLAFWLRKK